jgi:hypothetical protein
MSALVGIRHRHSCCPQRAYFSSGYKQLTGSPRILMPLKYFQNRLDIVAHTYILSYSGSDPDLRPAQAKSS